MRNHLDITIKGIEMYDKPYETESYSYLGNYIFYLKPNYVETDKDRPYGSLQAGKYYFVDETERIDGNGPFNTEEECLQAFSEYCRRAWV